MSSRPQKKGSVYSDELWPYVASDYLRPPAFIVGICHLCHCARVQAWFGEFVKFRFPALQDVVSYDVTLGSTQGICQN